ncbi:MAG: hypothetical protein IPI11_14350 [Haliscomenobacter sp.]|nr:hypothetical protein [Haliscomenobacter sp.]
MDIPPAVAHYCYQYIARLPGADGKPRTQFRGRKLFSSAFSARDYHSSSFFLLSIKLATSITREGILIRFSPFVKRFIPWEEVEKAYVRTYRPILEYGGWGIRFGAGGSRAYNISGNQGLQLVLKNGKKILVGTQKTESLALVLRNLGFSNP